jgi:hypothetical protein
VGKLLYLLAILNTVAAMVVLVRELTRFHNMALGDQAALQGQTEPGGMVEMPIHQRLSQTLGAVVGARVLLVPLLTLMAALGMSHDFTMLVVMGVVLQREF